MCAWVVAWVGWGARGVLWVGWHMNICGEHMWSRDAEREQVRGLQYKVAALISSPNAKVKVFFS